MRSLLVALALLGCRAEPTPAVDRAAPALHAPATVHFDSLGVAHIRAESEYDAFFLQGYTTARDRMGQMELLRRRAHGRRAEVLGEDHFLDDWQMRALGFTDLGERTWDALQDDDPDSAATFAAYAEGVNAWLAAVDAGDEAASPQLMALGLTPEPWTPADSLAIEKLIIAGSTMRITQELLVGLARQFMGEDLFTDLYRYAPLDPAVVVPGFVDGLAGPPPPQASGGGARLDAALGPEGAMALWSLAERWQQQDPLPVGSNAFAVAGTHTASGNALLEGDTHQGMGSPAVYTLVDLHARKTGLRMAGASFAGLPFVLFGTNGVVAWSATNGLMDHSDLYLEVPDGTTGVVFEGETVPFETTVHDIAVRAEGGSVGDAEVRTVETQVVPHHGPVLPTETLGLPIPLTVSVRWTGFLERSLMPTFRALGESTDVDGITGVLRADQGAGIAWVYADIHGRIGASAMTRLPEREQLDPSAPPVSLLPGDGGYEWLGGGAPAYSSVYWELIPEVVDPPRGFVAAANNDPGGANLDNDPFNDPTWYSGLFDVGTRAAQIEARLEALDGQATWDDMADVQLDTTSRIAGRFLPFLLRAAERRPDLVSPGSAEALALLADWDLRCETDQVGPTLFHGWLAVFMRDMLADDMGLVGELLFGDLPGAPALTMANTALYWLEATDADIDAIEAGDLPFPSVSGRNFFDDTNTDEVETRDALLLASLDQALVELTAACPDIDTDLAACTWGRVHTLGLTDPAAAFLPGADVPAQPKAGGMNTVDAADFPLLEGGVLPDHFAVDNAPSNRFLFELDPAGIRGAWVLPGGQSEDPQSPHHSDQFDRYMQGELVAMPLTEAEVEAAAAETWALEAGFGG